MRKAAVWVLALAVGIQTGIGMSVWHVSEAQRVLSGFLGRATEVRRAWVQPGAGEVSAAATIFRREPISRYRVSDGLRSDPAAYYGTVSGAWPARPDKDAPYRIRFAGESQFPCVELDRADGIALDDCH